MRPTLPLLLVCAVGAVGCDTPQRSLLDLQRHQPDAGEAVNPEAVAPAPSAIDAGADLRPVTFDAGVLDASTEADLDAGTTDAGSSGDAGQDANASLGPASDGGAVDAGAPGPPTLPGLHVGDTVSYTVTLKPSLFDGFARRSVTATLGVVALQPGVATVRIKIVPGVGAPAEQAFDGLLRLSGTLQDDFAIDAFSLKCNRTTHRCTLPKAGSGSPTAVLQPTKRQLAVGGGIVRYERRLEVGRTVTVAVAAHAPGRGFTAATGDEAMRSALTPLTFVSRRLVSANAPGKYQPPPEALPVSGLGDEGQRASLLETRAAAMAACRDRFPLVADRPGAEFTVRLTFKPNGSVLEGNVVPTGTVNPTHPYVLCILEELGRRVRLDTRRAPVLGVSAQLQIPNPD